jgi:hypothetical protein
MNVGIFYSSIRNFHKFPHKTALMDVFRNGVTVNGDIAIEFKSEVPVSNIPALNAGFILGYTLEKNYRKQLIDFLRARKSKIIYVDSNIFSYGKSAHHYHRYSVDGVYPTDGEYFLGPEIDRSRWDTISKFHKIELKPWRQKGEHILLLGQRTLSWNMLGLNGLDWIIDIIRRIRALTDRKIVVRLHPGDTKKNPENRDKINQYFHRNNVIISYNDDIRADLQNAWCSVGYNSTPNCVSAIEGVPVYIDEPKNSWAKGVAFESLDQINNPPTFDREEWIHRLSNIHWNNDEINQGMYWRKFKKFYGL